MKISPVGAGRIDGQTDMTKPIDDFRSFAKAPKISTFCPHCIYMFCVYFRTNSTHW